jgi:nucleotide-binding universal stress UspA family protein
MIGIQNILVAVDFSKASRYAAEYAASMAKACQARLYVLHVKEPFPAHGRIVAGSLEHVQKHLMRKEKSQLPELIPKELKNSIAIEEIQLTGMPVHRVIVEKAKHLNVDVIVMRSQKPGGWKHFFKKDITAQVIQDAPCSVFVVRHPQNQDTSSNESDP